MRSEQKEAGFTLTELLVTLSVMGVLIAIFYSAMGSVQRRGRLAMCAHNLREIGLLMQNYLGEYRVYPGCSTQTYTGTGAEGPNRYWAQDISEYAKLKDLRCFICPEVKKKDIRPELASNQGGYAYVSYAINRNGVAPGITDSARPVRSTAIPEPSKLLFAFDFDNPDQPCDGWYTATRGQVELYWKTVAARHSGCVNALYCDGHVETLLREGIFGTSAKELPWVNLCYS